MSDHAEPDTTGSAHPTLHRLWAQSVVRRRGPKPTLTVDAVIAAALELADAEGLAAVSMSRVAATLGCTSMALYRHVAGKDELLALLADRVAADAPAIPPALGWREGLNEWTQRQIDGALAHPWVLDLPLASMPIGPHRARWIDQGFAVLRRLDLPTAEKGQILALLGQHVLAEAQILLQLHQAANNPFIDLARNIDHLSTVEKLPHLFVALADGASDAANGPDESTRQPGIELILDGVAARLRRRRRPPR